MISKPDPLSITALLASVFLFSLCQKSTPAVAGTNLIPNPLFTGTGGTQLGATGEVPDQWRAFAVGGGAASTTLVPLAENALYPGSSATRAVKLSVAAFGSDQGFDHDGARFAMIPGERYHLEFYVKTGNADGSSQGFYYGFPLFKGDNYTGRDPGKGSGTATSTWKKIVGPTFSDGEATFGHVSFRVPNDPGEDSILIALPAVAHPFDRFPPPTPEALAQKQTWESCHKLVGATYFYWYRWPDMHFFDNAQQTDDALTDHFVDPASVSMLSKAWHKKEMVDVIEAGIDMIWPVYWAAPGNFDHPHWSMYVQGLLPLQEAIDELRAEGKTPPRIGLFYDTSSLLNDVRGVLPAGGRADLTTPEGKDVFYGTIRSFFSTIHPRHWACLEGRPIVVLYASAFAANYNQSTFDHLNTRFAADFGVTPFVIREVSWSVQADSSYQWGSAVVGALLKGIAAVGPGYDDIAVPGRTRTYTPRDGGQFYRANWEKVLASNCKIVHVETWNEMHEGTDICESVEYGRQYIALTREYADRFKAISTPIPIRVTGMIPAPNSRPMVSPAEVVATFDRTVLPASANSQTVFLTHAGPDFLFDTPDDVRIQPAAVGAGGQQVRIDLAGVSLPNGRYLLTLVGTGAAPLAGACGPLYGLFAGALPSGFDNRPGTFRAAFSLAPSTVAPDFDMDGDVDQIDFGHLQACFSGPGLPYDLNCQDATLDANSKVDGEDLRIFRKCWTGPGRSYELNCAGQ